MSARLCPHTSTHFAAAQGVIDGVIDHYNHHRLHSSLNFLRPVDYDRDDPEPLLTERRR